MLCVPSSCVTPTAERSFWERAGLCFPACALYSLFAAAEPICGCASSELNHTAVIEIDLPTSAWRRQVASATLFLKHTNYQNTVHTHSEDSRMFACSMASTSHAWRIGVLRTWCGNPRGGRSALGRRHSTGMPSPRMTRSKSGPLSTGCTNMSGPSYPTNVRTNDPLNQGAGPILRSLIQSASC